MNSGIEQCAFWPAEKRHLAFMGNSNVIASCEKYITIYASDCSGFVSAVAREFGFILLGQANNIFTTLSKDALPQVIKYGNGMLSARRAAEDAANGVCLVIGASFSPYRHGHVAIIVGKDATGHILVYGGKLNEPNNASYNAVITHKAWAKYKLLDPYVAAEPPYFFGLPIRPPLIG
jgi:hypothetical protein